MFSMCGSLCSFFSFLAGSDVLFSGVFMFLDFRTPFKMDFDWFLGLVERCGFERFIVEKSGKFSVIFGCQCLGLNSILKCEYFSPFRALRGIESMRECV